MTKKLNQLVPDPQGYAVKDTANSEARPRYRTAQQAIRAARGIAIKRQSVVLIHGSRGQIRERNTYGDDPYPPKG